jgi:hypothetical protein
LRALLAAEDLEALLAKHWLSVDHTTLTITDKAYVSRVLIVARFHCEYDRHELHEALWAVDHQ